jgi:hypothetical protein
MVSLLHAKQDYSWLTCRSTCLATGWRGRISNGGAAGSSQCVVNAPGPFLVPKLVFSSVMERLQVLHS